MLNSVSALALSAYLFSVLFAGNAGNLWAKLKAEGAFVKWAIALSVLLAFKESEAGKDLGGPLIVLALVAMALKTAENKQLSTAAKQIGAVIHY